MTLRHFSGLDRVVALRTGLTAAILATIVSNSTFACRCGADGDLDATCAVDGADLGLLLGAWDTADPLADLNSDGWVDGADLGVLLASWGPCEIACDGYTQVNLLGDPFLGQSASVPTIVATGTIDVLPNGEPQGLLIVVMFGGGDATITFAKGTVTIFTGGSVITLPPGEPNELALVDGDPSTITALLEAFEFDLQSGAPTAEWSAQGQAILALEGLSQDPSFCCNLVTSLEIGTEADSYYWCKLGTSSIGGAIVASSAKSCGSLEDGCEVDSSGSVGHFPMPCESLEKLCVDGEFAGAQASFDAVLGLWLGQ